MGEQNMKSFNMHLLGSYTVQTLSQELNKIVEKTDPNPCPQEAYVLMNKFSIISPLTQN